MTQISRFWDGTTLGDATVAPYDAGTEFSEVMSAVGGAAATPDRGGTIKNLQGDLGISSPSAGVVRIGPGEALVYGAWYRSDTNVDHTFASPAAAARSDRIVLRKSWTSQTVRQVVVTGSEGGAVPALVQTVGDTWDVPVAQINIATNGTITITDQRVQLGIPPVDLILTDPTIRDTLFFGAKPSGSGDALIRRIGPNHLSMPSENFTVGILNIDGPDIQERAVKFMRSGSMRWYWGIPGGNSEPGANQGSDVALYRYDNAGAYIAPVLTASRASGAVTFHGNPSVTSPGVLTVHAPSTLVLSTSATMHFAVAGAYAHPSTDSTTYLGHPSYRWAGIYTMNLSAASSVSAGILYGNELHLNNGGRSIHWNPAQTAWYAWGFANDGYMRLQYGGGNTPIAIDSAGNMYSAALFPASVNTTYYSSPGNIVFTPAAGYAYPDSHGARYLGHPSSYWAGVYAASMTSYGQLTLSAAGGSIALVNGTGVYLRSGNIIGVDTGAAPLNYFAPEVDNKSVCGSTAGGRWTYIAAVNGSINTCRASEKLVLGEIDPEWALDAIIRTPIKRFKAKDYRGVVDDTFEMAGIVDDCADPRMQIGEGSVTSAGHQAALSMASIQRLHARISDLERQIEWLMKNQ